MTKILIVDDDRRMRRTLQIVIERMGFESVAAMDAAEAREHIANTAFDLVLTDLKMPETSGVELLQEIRATHPTIPVIVITAYGTIQTAIEAMRQGASDFVLKPFDNDNLEFIINRSLALERYRNENNFLRKQVEDSWAPEEVFLSLSSMQGVAEIIERVAPTTSPILVTGETGTGKELAARCIHKRSPRSNELFVPLNCAALPGELLEAELFGHARGAFTGAEQERQGKFELANGGTLFLDEIGDMPITLQAKLLRVLEDGIVEPLGTNKRVRVDIRVISATNQDMRQAIADKRFRDDLYYRINTIELRLPPLRDRTGDLDTLAPLFLERYAMEIGKQAPTLTDDALELLRRYDWPGNVRELRNVMERAAVLSNHDILASDFFAPVLPVKPEDSSPNPGNESDPREDLAEGRLVPAVEAFERRMILRALDQTKDNKAKAARALGISERNLWYKLRKHSL